MAKSDIKLYHGDCLGIMKRIPDGSVDMVLCDLPYGTTSCRWDAVISVEPLFSEYWRVLKAKSPIVLTSTQPFTTALIGANLKTFRYCWYWNKPGVTGFANAKKQPLRCVEDIVVFCRAATLYNPQGLLRVEKSRKNSKTVGGESLRTDVTTSSGKGSLRTGGKEYVQEFTNFPRQVLQFGSEGPKIHPTQKPVALMDYLIRTYTNEGDTVLDNCMGSGTTGVAAKLAGRKFIGIEMDDKYFEIAKGRIDAAR